MQTLTVIRTYITELQAERCLYDITPHAVQFRLESHDTYYLFVKELSEKIADHLVGSFPV